MPVFCELPAIIKLSWTPENYDYLGIDARAPRPIFKEAFAQGLLDEEQVWLDMIEMRNLPSQVYDEHEISRILDQLERYLHAFDGLKSRLQKTLSTNSDLNQP